MASFVFSVELWNGFTTDMDPAAVLERANEVLNITKPYFERDRSNYYILNRNMRTYKLPSDNLHILFVFSNIDGLSQNDDSLQRRPRDYNITFYFFNNKLIVLSVIYSEDIKLFNATKEKYGNPTAIEKASSPYLGESDIEYPMWQLPNGRDLFVTVRSSPESIYIDRMAKEKYMNELKHEEEQKRKDEAERQRERNSKIIF
jgi:hypothetical protein